LESWKVGKLEGWKVGRLEGWKVGRLEGKERTGKDSTTLLLFRFPISGLPLVNLPPKVT